MRAVVGSRRAEDARRTGSARGVWLGGLAGAVLALAFLWAFHAAAVVDAGAAWERAWLLAIHATWGAPATGAASTLRLLGTAYAIVPLTATAVVWWTPRGARWKARRLLAVTAALTAVDFLGKAWFARPRPALFPHPYVPGASYPSGHALFAVGFYGPLAALALVGAGGALRVAGLSLWAALAAALGTSRLVLGVHWPTDVIAGAVAGAIVWAAVWAATPGGAPERSPPRPPPHGG